MRIRIQGGIFNADPCGSGYDDKNIRKIKEGFSGTIFLLPGEEAGEGEDPLHCEVRRPAEGRLQAQMTTL